MPTQNDKVITGVVITIIVFLLIGFFIMVLVAYFNKRKKNFVEEKESLRQQFTEQLFQSQLEMQEHTFNAISQEIHDNVGQTLSLAKVQLNILNEGSDLNRILVSDIKESVSKALLDLRDIAKSLNSEKIRHSSLIEMTSLELARIKRLGIITVKLTTVGSEHNQDEQKKLIVFRILQEGLQNILKHANAKNIYVTFDYQHDSLKIELADNGIGFEHDLLEETGGLGLQNISNRATLIGGELTINSNINIGTVITINLPYD